jgi:energy-coupling factor transporter ATP-binding protein EcfA2
LLEFAESMLASFGDARLVWLAGLPGSGKSTLLRACRVVDDRTQTIELSRELAAMGHSDGPPRPGGLQALGDAVGRVRTRCAQQSARSVVATTGIPIESVPCIQRELLLVLSIDPARADLQLRSRPQRAARTATPAEIVMHHQNLERLARLPHARLVEVPLIPTLVGREVP